MKRSKWLFCCLALFACSEAADAQNTNNTAAKTGYASVNGLKMYYEIHGDGQPLLLLHGSHATIETTFGPMIPALKQHHKVIAVELQGHGHTADIDRQITCEAMADDISALINQLKLEKVDILGYSMGSGVALNVAIKHPELIRKMVLLSPVYKSEGIQPDYWPMLPTIKPEIFEGSPVKQAYDSVAPDPKNWPVLVDKLKTIYTRGFDWNKQKISTIKSPVMVVIGDADMVKAEHAVEMFRIFGGGQFGDLKGLPNSQLAILPATTHVGMLFRSDWLLPMIQSFLDQPVK
ncbi:alpha/beta hydrolase [Chitinophaga lutea]|uniref:Alpha/beta hydrolase n=1 Tax=Chitinophaga lutea TaxID=2488634 RepID=A0A3N4PQL9_9BACT|nr:alpha/beta hydrolase [Chitinophaga lutea]RPE09995.1 alpha/beta hydrolase [Chitinophaga lutea]